ncbi:MAG: hypothetical protein ABF296_07240 [Oceanococcaceae bacterium]
MLAQLAHVLPSLLLLRAGPQDLPATPLALQWAALAYVLSTVARLLLVNPALAALAQAALSLGVLWVYVRLVLQSRNKPERFTQTLTALLMTGTVIGVLMLGPLTALTPLLLQIAEGRDLQALEVPSLAAYAWLALSVWGLVLAGHIFRHALDTGLGMGMLIALGYELALIAAVSLLAIPMGR